jgi:hypothetical protein
MSLVCVLSFYSAEELSVDFELTKIEILCTLISDLNALKITVCKIIILCVVCIGVNRGPL